jgi:hypothetical protein
LNFVVAEAFQGSVGLGEALLFDVPSGRFCWAGSVVEMLSMTAFVMFDVPGQK